MIPHETGDIKVDMAARAANMKDHKRKLYKNFIGEIKQSFRVDEKVLACGSVTLVGVPVIGFFCHLIWTHFIEIVLTLIQMLLQVTVILGGMSAIILLVLTVGNVVVNLPRWIQSFRYLQKALQKTF